MEKEARFIHDQKLRENIYSIRNNVQGLTVASNNEKLQFEKKINSLVVGLSEQVFNYLKLADKYYRLEANCHLMVLDWDWMTSLKIVLPVLPP